MGFAAMGFVAAGVGAAALGAGAGAAFGGVEGVIGAFCANAGVASANTAAIATPFKSCFMIIFLCGSFGFVTTRQRRAQHPRAAWEGLRSETTGSLFRSNGYATFRLVSDLAGAG